MWRAGAIFALTVLQMAGAAACQLRVALAPAEYPARVVGMSPDFETARQTRIGEAKVGGPVSPRYRKLPHVLADFADESGFHHVIISAVTDGHVPPPGSVVVIRSRYLDPDDDCQYIPWTVKPEPPIM